MPRFARFALATALGLSPAPGLAVVTLSAYGTATVDGVHSPGEYESAAVRSFQANLPAGGTTPATFYVMNDGTNLYLALYFPAWSGLPQSSMDLLFDNNNNAVCDAGEDALTLNSTSPTFLNDTHWTADCALNFYDDNEGGTLDGAAHVISSAPSSFWEISHPLDDADDAHDFSLSIGSVAGFRFSVVLCGGICISTYYPAQVWGLFGEIVIAPADWIFADGFEAVSFAAWSSVAP